MLSYKVNDQIDLRLLGERHASELFQLTDRNREHLRNWMPWVDGTRSEADSKQFIQFSRKCFADEQALNLGIFVDGKLAGNIGLHQIDRDNRQTSIGYWLSSDVQGQGIMTMVCSKMLEYIFNELQLNRVEIQAAVGNAKSRAVPERLGFTQEGIKHQSEWLYDHFVDHVVYGMLKEDWLELESKSRI